MRAFYRPQGDTSLPEYLDRHRFPADPWRLVETKFESDDLGVGETIFAVGNGYLGMRGSVSEAHDAHSPGTFINGFHETWPIRHAEEAFGFARVGQTIATAPDPTVIRLYVNDEPLILSYADLEHYSRALDFRDGLLARELIWRTPSGNRVRVVSRRMASMVHRHLALMTFEVTVLDEAAPVAVSSQLLNRAAGIDEDAANREPTNVFDPRKASALAERVLVPRLQYGDDSRVVLGYQTAHSKMALAVAMEHWVTADAEVTQETRIEPDYAKHVYLTQLEPGQSLSLTKAVVYHTSSVVPARELADRCHRTLNRVRSEGAAKQFDAQRRWFDDFWERSDVEVVGDEGIQQAVRFNLFHLAQAGARADGMGVAAKGVTGSGYGGHYFWDTEIYVAPFFIHTSPTIARNLLRFRHRMLPAARARAGELAQHGVLFPWRTINGEEASAYYAAGTAQYHINADVSYALGKYVRATGDYSFMRHEGVDILVETARMWADLGFWRRVKGEPPSFRIHGVTGPDEYTTVVNDNLYTNVMARFNLRLAAQTVRDLQDRHPGDYDQLITRLALDMEEVEEWERAADGMAILWDDTLAIHLQDASFNQREMWDLAATPPDKRPLLLHFHPLVIYRFQVLKQADVVLALFLQGHEFTPEQKRANFDYYDPITAGDSTLSGAVQSIIASEVGYADLALSYFWDAVFVDLADLHGNTAHGMHIASAGGAWAALVNGFGGMRDHDDVLHFDPRLPEAWESLSFVLTQRATRFKVTVVADSVSFEVLQGPGISVVVRGVDVSIEPGEKRVVALDHQGPALRGAPVAEDLRGTVRADGSVITTSLPTVVEAVDTDLAIFDS